MEEFEKSFDAEWGGRAEFWHPNAARSRMGERGERILNDYLSRFSACLQFPKIQAQRDPSSAAGVVRLPLPGSIAC
jgi:hypothetical protein